MGVTKQWGTVKVQANRIKKKAANNEDEDFLKKHENKIGQPIDAEKFQKRKMGVTKQGGTVKVQANRIKNDPRSSTNDHDQ